MMCCGCERSSSSQDLAAFLALKIISCKSQDDDLSIGFVDFAPQMVMSRTYRIVFQIHTIVMAKPPSGEETRTCSVVPWLFDGRFTRSLESPSFSLGCLLYEYSYPRASQSFCNRLRAHNSLLSQIYFTPQLARFEHRETMIKLCLLIGIFMTFCVSEVEVLDVIADAGTSDHTCNLS